MSKKIPVHTSHRKNNYLEDIKNINIFVNLMSIQKKFTAKEVMPVEPRKHPRQH